MSARRGPSARHGARAAALGLLAAGALALGGTPHRAAAQAVPPAAAPLTRGDVERLLAAAPADQPPDLRGANLAGADLGGLDFRRADLTGARLEGTRFAKAQMFGVNLSGARAGRADFTGAVLDVAVLRGTDLTRARLRDASLYATILIDADLTEADLSGARVIGVFTN